MHINNDLGWSTQVIPPNADDPLDRGRLEIYRKIRHEQYCEKRTWEPRNKGNLESDFYDDVSFSILLLDGDKQPIGGVRLIPSGTCMLPIEELCGIHLPSGTFEVSRLVIRKGACTTRALGREAERLLYRAVHDFVQAHGSGSTVYAVICHRLLRTFRERWRLDVISPRTSKKGDEIFFPVRMELGSVSV